MRYCELADSKSSGIGAFPPPRFWALALSHSLDKKCFKEVSRNARNRPRSAVAEPT